MVFGGGGTGVVGTPTEGEWNRRLAVERGVPEGAALAAGRAQFTSDESRLVAERLGELGAKSLTVCSSVAHRPRAAVHYRRLGFTVTALPSDFATRGAAEGWSIKLLIPRSIALAQTDNSVREWLGILVGLVR
jgi:uncharacterized SAM-binding protein YcdF (DUF218 family)